MADDGTTRSESAARGAGDDPGGGSADPHGTGTDGAEAPESEAREHETAVLHAVTRGAGISIGGILLQRGLLFATNLLLTNSLGVAAYGLYALGRRIVGMLQGFAHLGSNPTLVRLLPKHADAPDRQRRVLGTAYLTTAVTSATLAAGLFAFAPTIESYTAPGDQFVPVLRAFAVLLPVLTFVWQIGNVFRSLERLEYQVVIVRVLRPAAQLLAVGAAFAFGLSVLGVIGSVVVALAGVLAVAVGLSRSKLSIRPRPPKFRGEVREFYDFALPNSLSTFGALLRSRVDVLLIGALLAAEGAGIYNIALFLTGLVSLPLMSINQLFPPVASRLYSDGDVETLRATYSTATRWILTAGLFIAVYEIVFRVQLLGLFGPAYRRGELVLVAFAVGQVVNCAVGSAGWLLLMSDHQYVAAANNWVLGIVNLGLSYALILEYGLIGAALGTAGSLTLVNVMRVSELWYLEGIQPYDRAFAKPLAAAVVAAAAGALLRPAFGGVSLLVVGAVGTLGAFLATLVALGPEPEDRDLQRAVAEYVAAWL
ncbi:MAG: flippase [Halosimplex sp.]